MPVKLGLVTYIGVLRCAVLQSCCQQLSTAVQDRQIECSAGHSPVQTGRQRLRVSSSQQVCDAYGEALGFDMQRAEQIQQPGYKDFARQVW